MRSFSKYFFALAFAAALSVSAAAQCVAPPAGMTNWWTADGHAIDIVGDNDGTLVNGATYAAGQVGQAFSLDGTNDHVRVPHDEDAEFNFENSFTIDAWINLDTLPAEFAPIVSKWNDIGVNQRSYFLAVQNINGQAFLRFDVSRNGLFGGTNSASAVSATPIALDTWYHVAAVYDAATRTLRLYINGQLVATDVLEGTLGQDAFENDEPLLIGAGDLGGNIRDFFDGLIDEVELFDRALTQAEIQSIYNADDGKTLPLDFEIKPDDDDEDEPAPINLKSKGKTPVVIYGSAAFDVTDIDVSQIRFAGASVAMKKNGTYHYSYEDVNGDGYLDLVLHFNTQDLQLDEDDTTAMLSGVTFEERCFSGTDEIVIVP